MSPTHRRPDWRNEKENGKKGEERGGGGGLGEADLNTKRRRKGKIKGRKGRKRATQLRSDQGKENVKGGRWVAMARVRNGGGGRDV